MAQRQGSTTPNVDGFVNPAAGEVLGTVVHHGQGAIPQGGRQGVQVVAPNGVMRCLCCATTAQLHLHDAKQWPEVAANVSRWTSHGPSQGTEWGILRPTKTGVHPNDPGFHTFFDTLVKREVVGHPHGDAEIRSQFAALTF